MFGLESLRACDGLEATRTVERICADQTLDSMFADVSDGFDDFMLVGLDVFWLLKGRAKLLVGVVVDMLDSMYFGAIRKAHDASTAIGPLDFGEERIHC